MEEELERPKTTKAKGKSQSLVLFEKSLKKRGSAKKDEGTKGKEDKEKFKTPEKSQFKKSVTFGSTDEEENLSKIMKKPKKKKVTKPRAKRSLYRKFQETGIAFDESNLEQGKHKHSGYTSSEDSLDDYDLRRQAAKSRASRDQDELCLRLSTSSENEVVSEAEAEDVLAQKISSTSSSSSSSSGPLMEAISPVKTFSQASRSEVQKAPSSVAKVLELLKNPRSIMEEVPNGIKGGECVILSLQDEGDKVKNAETRLYYKKIPKRVWTAKDFKVRVGEPKGPYEKHTVLIYFYEFDKDTKELGPLVRWTGGADGGWTRKVVKGYSKETDPNKAIAPVVDDDVVMVYKNEKSAKDFSCKIIRVLGTALDSPGNKVSDRVYVGYKGKVPENNPSHGNLKAPKKRPYQPLQNIQKKRLEQYAEKGMHPSKILNKMTLHELPVEKHQAAYVRRKHTEPTKSIPEAEEIEMVLQKVVNGHKYLCKLIIDEEDTIIPVRCKGNIKTLAALFAIDTKKSNYKPIIHVDTTFNMCSKYVTCFSFQHPVLTWEHPQVTNAEKPSILVFSALHGRLTERTYTNICREFQRELDKQVSIHTKKFDIQQRREGVYLGILNRRTSSKDEFAKKKEHQFILGSDQDRALINSFTNVFGDVTNVLCTKHLKDNLGLMAQKNGVKASVLRGLRKNIFDGDDALVRKGSAKAFETKASEILEFAARNIDGSRSKIHSITQYIGGLLQRVETNVWKPCIENEWVDADFTNNLAESINSALKKYTGQRSRPINFVIDAIGEFMEAQSKDSRNALFSKGRYRAIFHKKYKEFERSHSEFAVMKEDAKEILYLNFLDSAKYIKRNKAPSPKKKETRRLQYESE